MILSPNLGLVPKPTRHWLGLVICPSPLHFWPQQLWVSFCFLTKKNVCKLLYLLYPLPESFLLPIFCLQDVYYHQSSAGYYHLSYWQLQIASRLGSLLLHYSCYLPHIFSTEARVMYKYGSVTSLIFLKLPAPWFSIIIQIKSKLYCVWKNLHYLPLPTSPI